MRPIKRFFILSLMMIIYFNQVNAQSEKWQIIDHAFKNKKELYFSFTFQSKNQLNLLSKIISIDKIEGQKAYAYASRDDFDQFLDSSIEYQILEHPNSLFTATMFDAQLKKTYAWDSYLTYEDYVDIMYQFAADYPTICQVFSIGESVEGREILMAKISDNIANTEDEPQFLYSGQIHGDELVTSILMLRLIDYLTSNYGSDAQVNNLVNEIEIWINPLANPDGLYAGGNQTVNGATRFNANGVDINRNFPDPEDGDHPDGKSWQTETLAFIKLADEQHFTMSANTHAGVEVVNYPWDTWSRLAADDNWWQLVAHEYADLAQANSPSGYMEGWDDGITNGYDWYSVAGGRQDYMNYFHQCREVTLEQSIAKFLSIDKLPAFWDYNKQAMLNYLEQVTYGFRGKITDAETGDPIQAKIEIEGHDFDNSYVTSNAQGNYYRPIKSGTYTLQFSADAYDSKTISNQIIGDFDSKTIDVQLQKTSTAIDESISSSILIANPIVNHRLKITSPVVIKEIKIYSILGQLLYAEKTNASQMEINLEHWKGAVYLVDLEISSGKHIQKKILAN